MRELQVGSLTVRSARKSDLSRYITIQKIEWKGSAVAKNQAQSRFRVNLGGILVAEDEGIVVGSVTTMRIDRYNFRRPKSWYAVTDNGLCTNHQIGGKVCFGVDLSVDTRKAPSGTVDALFVGCMQLIISYGVKHFILGGRMPSYRKYKRRMKPKKYLYSKHENGHYLDPQVDMYSRVPFMKIMGLAPNYFKDPASGNFGVMLRWRNPFYKLPLKQTWANLACLVFEKYLKRQRKVYKKKLEKMPL